MAKVAIYDSGVGGLSIYRKIFAACKSADLVFVSDNEAYPYGIKAESELLLRVSKVGKAILEQCNPDVLVLACNTASTVCLPSLREQLSIPVVGVVPAIKPASKISRSKTIGLIATPATITRPYTSQLIQDFASQCTVIKLGSKALVDMAESKIAGERVELDKLESILRPFTDNAQLDVLVLACTHFPLLEDEINHIFECADRQVALIDSGGAIASRVSALLGPDEGIRAASYSALFTKPLETEQLSNHLKSMNIDRISTLSV